MAFSASQADAAQGQAPPVSANNRIQIALIGAGGMGMGDAKYAVSIPGNALVAVCDLYDGRLARAKELWGSQIYTTRDYREVLARKDVDAVIIGTPDHWHSRITIDALKAGKDVYCEKPMVQKVEQGWPVVEAHKSSGRIMQVGSQYVSSLIYQKAREILKSGAIGELNMVEAWLDRNDAMGAWTYSIPPDASPETVDWDRFLGDAPRRPFDAVRFFRWRNYRDYGTSVAGDLFVHLLSGLHFVTGSQGPNRIYASGGIRYWKDGRETPDVLLATMDYPKSDAHPDFTLALRVNFKSSSPDERFGFRFVGSEGTIVTGGDVSLTKMPARESGYYVETFPKRIRDAYFAEEKKKQPRMTAENLSGSKNDVFVPPPGYSSHLEHHKVFWEGVRTRKQVIEDALFGYRAAGPALLSNTSYYEQRVCKWDPSTLKEVEA